MALCFNSPGFSWWTVHLAHPSRELRRGGAHARSPSVSRTCQLPYASRIDHGRIVPWSQRSSGRYSWRGLHVTFKISHLKARIRRLWLTHLDRLDAKGYSRHVRHFISELHCRGVPLLWYAAARAKSKCSLGSANPRIFQDRNSMYGCSVRQLPTHRLLANRLPSINFLRVFLP